MKCFKNVSIALLLALILSSKVYAAEGEIFCVESEESIESTDTEVILESSLLGKAPIVLESLSITGNPVAVVGKNTTYKAAFSPANATNKAVEWSVSPEEEGVTISSGGLLKVSADCKLTICEIRIRQLTNKKHIESC